MILSSGSGQFSKLGSELDPELDLKLDTELDRGMPAWAGFDFDFPGLQSIRLSRTCRETKILLEGLNLLMPSTSACKSLGVSSASMRSDGSIESSPVPD